MPSRLAAPADLQADASRAVAGRVVDDDAVVAESVCRAVVVGVDRRRRTDLEAEHRPLFDGAFVEIRIVFVQIDRRLERLFRGGDAGYAIDVRVGQQDMAYVDVEIADGAD